MPPRLSQLRLSEREGSFRIHGCDASFANGIRCAMLRDIETPAITRAIVMANTTCFPSEWVAHRCGQVPIRCRGGVQGQTGRMRLKADVKGRVYSSSIVSEEEAAGGEASQHEVVEPDVLILTLSEGQRIDLELLVESHPGSVHARHNPSVAARFVERREEQAQHEVDAVGGGVERCMCPNPLLPLRPPDVAGDKTTMRCQECGHAVTADDRGAKKGRRAETEKAYDFFFETTGSYTARELLVLAVSSIHTTMHHIREDVERQFSAHM